LKKALIRIGLAADCWHTGWWRPANSTDEYMPRHGLLIFSMLAAAAAGSAQVNLTGISYTQDFNSLGSGLPAGWSVNTSTTSSTLGNPGSFTAAATTWAASTTLTDFRNVAGDNIAFGSASGTQSSDLNRALGWRPLAAATDARSGSIMLTIANTTGFQDFALSVQVFTGNDSSTSSQSYLLEYRVGDTGNFTPIATYLTPTTGATGFNAQTFTANPVTLSALNDQPDTVYFRLRGTATSGTSLDSIALDDFSLTYSAVAVPEPPTYAAVLGGLALLGMLIRRRSPAVS
jgi:hypothetical protein